MLTNLEIWATECTGLNDLSEVVGGFEYMSQWFGQRPGSAAASLHTLCAPTGGTVARAQEVFIVCASLNGDDAGQWRLYGGVRAGYSVELDPGVSLGVISRSADPASYPASARRPRSGGTLWKAWGQQASVAPWYPVAYSDAARERMLSDLLTWANEVDADYERAASDPTLDPEERDQMGQDLGERFEDALCTAAALIKAPGFSGEREARAVVNAQLRTNHEEFRATGHGVVRYVRLATGDGRGLVQPEHHPGQTLPVRSITVGPTPYFEAQKSTLEALILRAGFKPSAVPVVESKVALRR
ncbi:hypothetical protein [Cellulomonas oligotrophica]|nr:hypothetical protein [Cellulomonas oligotrophica]NYD88007.1 hypothetical protein [Cellulomonas oligotrophica]